MNYKDTILKQSQIKWKNPKFKVKDDDNVDINITIPLTAILDLQARQSFAQGVLAALGFLGNDDRSIENLKANFIEWGMPKKLIDFLFKQYKKKYPIE